MDRIRGAERQTSNGHDQTGGDVDTEHNDRDCTDALPAGAGNMTQLHLRDDRPDATRQVLAELAEEEHPQRTAPWQSLVELDKKRVPRERTRGQTGHRSTERNQRRPIANAAERRVDVAPLRGHGVCAEPDREHERTSPRSSAHHTPAHRMFTAGESNRGLPAHCPGQAPAIKHTARTPRWRKGVNALLRRTGYQITRQPRVAQPGWRNGLAKARASTRLVQTPTFVLCTARSGSTLLRLLLNSHSQIRAPHEMHLWALRVQVEKEYATLSAKALHMDEDELEYQLWDRLLYRELQLSGKRQIVEKTPQNTFMWQRLTHAWPEARFIFLQRHPAAILASMRAAANGTEPEVVTGRLESYLKHLEEARAELPGLAVRYEDLTAQPEATLRRICDFLQVPFERRMLEYETNDHGPLVMGLGDWSEKLRSGRVHDADPVPDVELSDGLRRVAAEWGYDVG
jgi:hypothetical protein